MGKDATKKAWLKWVVTGALALAVMPTVQACGDDDDATGDTTGSGPTGDDDDATNTTGSADTGATGGTGDDDDATDTTGATDTSGTGGTDTGGTDTGSGGGAIGYVEDIQPLIKNDCLSCHGVGVYQISGEGILLETQADVYRLKASVVNEVVRGKMPEGAPYDQPTRNLFAAWRTAGYPINRGE